MRSLAALSCFAAVVVTATVLASSTPAPTTEAVEIARVPDAGLQPQVVVDAAGTVHLLYLKGDASHSDIYYVRSESPNRFSPPIRVNSQPGSAMAMGNMRGPHLAVGRGGIVHVAWFGSESAQPRPADKSTPILYARLPAGATSFEPQRNVVQFATRLDGDAVAADADGRVYVAWHALGPDAKDEGDSRLWVAASADDGKTFQRERPASDKSVGACGCCGVGAIVDRAGALDLLYRSATAVVNRDTFFVTSGDHGATFSSLKLQDWHIGACPMSTFAFAPTEAGVIAAWETAGHVQFARIDRRSTQLGAIITAPAGSRNQKYPTVAVDAQGRVLLAWTEGMAWQRGGDLVWQVYDSTGRPTADRGRRSGVPPWSLVSAYATRDGHFGILY